MRTSGAQIVPPSRVKVTPTGAYSEFTTVPGATGWPFGSVSKSITTGEAWAAKGVRPVAATTWVATT
jgi:hypothetical protein